MEKRLPRLHIIIVMLICTLLGVGAGFVVYMQTARWNEFKQTAIETTAVITDISTHRTGSRKHRKTTHTVVVEYTVDGQTYSTKLNYYTSGMHEGGKVKLYYDPEDPSNSMSDPTLPDTIIGVIASLIFLAGIGLFIGEIKKCIIVNRLIAEDKYYLCEDWIEETAPVSVNNVRYHQIKCRITDDRGEEHVFFSSAFHPSKPPYKQGDILKIYVDLFEAPNVYYISKEPVRYTDKF